MTSKERMGFSLGPMVNVLKADICRWKKIWSTEIGSPWELSLWFAFHHHSLPPSLPQNRTRPMCSLQLDGSGIFCPAQHHLHLGLPLASSSLLAFLLLVSFFFQLASDCTLFSLHAPSHLIFHLYTLQRLLYPHCLRLYLAVKFGKRYFPHPIIMIMT